MRRFKAAGSWVVVAALAGCGGGGGGGSDGPVQNSAPIAVVGAATQNVLVGATVTLDGSGSRDTDTTNALSYRWTLTPPAGSAAQPSSAGVPRPTFVADVAGTYTATLVVNDGSADSAAATSTVVAASGNVAPVADAGPDQVVRVGSQVTVDGSRSRDANGDALVFKWQLLARPPTSNATLAVSGGTVRFTADVAGSYGVRLVAEEPDGGLESAPDDVVVNAVATGTNLPPVAAAGADRTVLVGANVTLDGRNSRDADGSIAVWSWKLVSQPAGSTQALTGADTATPRFVASHAGDYALQLSVGDNGGAIVGPDSVVVTAVPADLQLLGVVTGISGAAERTQLALPYTASATLGVQEGCTGCPTRHVVAVYELTAGTGGHVVSGLSTENLDGGAAPSFDGLAEGRTIAAGETVPFRLVAPLTGGQPQNLRWRFAVDGRAFDYSVQLRTP